VATSLYHVTDFSIIFTGALLILNTRLRVVHDYFGHFSSLYIFDMPNYMGWPMQGMSTEARQTVGKS
jgi:hypothetical protein